ncbi:hypothetical protein LCGC14_2504690 [marine sediment metagenome]|uniref:Uncharacterized protein n=1 Tax=marine sediment metagenome TaxID=412755 RepID=A0A0F9B0U0_9ZZZZ
MEGSRKHSEHEKSSAVFVLILTADAHRATVRRPLARIESYRQPLLSFLIGATAATPGRVSGNCDRNDATDPAESRAWSVTVF